MAQSIPAWATALLIACSSLPSHASAASEQAQTAQNKQLVAAAFDRWAAGGSSFFTEVLSPDVVWTIEGSSPTAGTYRGLDDFNARAVRPFVSRLRTPVRPVSQRVWADGEHVIVNWVGTAVALDGAPYRNHYAWIFRMRGGKAVEVNAFLDLAPYEDVIRRIPAPRETVSRRTTGEPTLMANHPYIGMWVTQDGRIRQELLPNGRYDEARGAKQSAYQGRYEVKGNHIDYWDDTGFTANGTFVNADELRHGGFVFYRQK